MAPLWLRRGSSPAATPLTAPLIKEGRDTYVCAGLHVVKPVFVLRELSTAQGCSVRSCSREVMQIFCLRGGRRERMRTFDGHTCSDHCNVNL
jgi:hypothetical protein